VGAVPVVAWVGAGVAGAGRPAVEPVCVGVTAEGEPGDVPVPKVGRGNGSTPVDGGGTAVVVPGVTVIGELPVLYD
jgi:hypothetical protein